MSCTVVYHGMPTCQAAGGHVIFAGCWRVQGDLAVSRAFGDAHLKSFGVSAEPQLSRFDLMPGYAQLILASDGLWDVVRWHGHGHGHALCACTHTHPSTHTHTSIHTSTSHLTSMYVCKHLHVQGGRGAVRQPAAAPAGAARRRTSSVRDGIAGT